MGSMWWTYRRNWPPRVRMLSTGYGRKNDDADTISVGIAALTAAGLRSTAVDETIAALRAVVEHRDDLIKQRTQTINRLHALLTKLIPAGAPTQLTADAAAGLLRTIRPRDIAGRTLRRLAVDLIEEVSRLEGASPAPTPTSRPRSSIRAPP
jgi:transposase